MADPVVVIGGGIVGLSTAWQLARTANAGPILVLEKERDVAQHQTGRNSGVIHSGIYYRPGSLKARLCREGRDLLIRYCADRDIPLEICGKVIVAVDEAEEARLPGLLERGRANGVACRRMTRDELREREPWVEGRAALLVEDTGIVDFGRVSRRLAEDLETLGDVVRLQCDVTAIARRGSGYRLETSRGPVDAGFVVNCAGLHADRVARLAGEDPGVTIVPFRGQYYELRGEAAVYCRHLVYPVPDPAYPFLGVHFTRMIDGRVECGPNAVLAFAREGYRFRDVNVRDLWEVLTWPGFQHLVRVHWRKGLTEMTHATARGLFVHALQRLVPAVQDTDLEPAPAGVRGQALTPDGTLADDFVIRDAASAVHVINAPSPAATAGLAIGSYLAGHVRARLTS